MCGKHKCTDHPSFSHSADLVDGAGDDANAEEGVKGSEAAAEPRRGRQVTKAHGGHGDRRKVHLEQKR